MKKIKGAILFIFVLFFAIEMPNAAKTKVRIKSQKDLSGAWPITNSEHSDWHTGRGAIFILEDETIAYCNKPDVDAPAAGVTFTDETETLTPEQKKVLNGMCSVIKKKSTSEIISLNLMRLAAAKVGKLDGTDNQRFPYEQLVGKKSGNYEFNTTSYPELANVSEYLQEAENYKSSGEETYTINQNKNTVSINTKIDLEISLLESEYELYVGAEKVDGNKKNLTPGTYIIKVQSASETDKSCVKNATLNISYDKSLHSDGSSATAKYYKVSGASNLQSAIGCQYNGEDTDCDLDASGKNCVDKIIINSCDTPEKTECDEPKVIIEKGDKDEGVLCKKDGTTVIAVTEYPNTITVENGQVECIKELADATNIMLGSTDNEYCNIYCSEDYNLVLPGPDSYGDNGDEEMFINAGTFFTIDDSNMKSQNKVTCYSVLDFDKYQTNINTYRSNVLSAYNKMEKARAYKDASKTIVTADDGTKYCSISAISYKELAFANAEGKVSSTTRTIAANSMANVSECSKDYTSEYNSAKSSYESIRATAQTEINKAKDSWKECNEWNFDEFINTIKEEDCDPTINFKYGQDVCNDITIERENIETNVTDGTNTTAKNGTVYYGICDESGNESSCNGDTSKEVNTGYISKSIKIDIKYKFNNDFTVNFETGEVSCEAKTSEEYSEVYYGFPVSIDTVQGKYAYAYNYSDIGYDFEKMMSGQCAMGRLDEVIDKVDKDKTYQCYYDVNSCGDCKVICDDPKGKHCETEFGDNTCDGNCKFACVGGGCLVDFGATDNKLLASYKTISLTNTVVGSASNHVLTNNPYQWLAMASKDNSTKPYLASKSYSNWKNSKGIATTEKINKKGEEIYDESAEYSVDLTPTIMKEIRRYNDGKTYANDTLKCSDAANLNFGQCISEFISNADFGIKRNFEILNNESTVIDNNGVMFASYPNYNKGEGAEDFIGPAWK